MKLWLMATSCLVLAGCRCRPPPEIICEHASYFVAPDLQLIPGRPPTPPARRGQAIAAEAIAAEPSMLGLKDSTHVEINWRRVDFYTPEWVIYSPQEQVGRSESQPGVIYWMSRTTTESSDTFRIGFMSPVCDDPGVIERKDYCWTYTREPMPLMAELTCKPEYLPSR